MSRTSNTSTVGEVDLNSPSAASGAQVSNSQREHNSIASFTGKAVNNAKDVKPSWSSDAIGTPNQSVKDRVDSVQAQVETNDADIDTKMTKITSVDETVPRFDGTGGEVQSSGVTIDDSDNVIIPGDLTVNGTTTTVNTDTLDVEDANITVNKGGTQATADANDAGLTVEMSDATDVIVNYDSTLASKWAAGEVGSQKEIVTVSDAQVITEKDIDFGTASNTRRIALPKDTTTNLDALTDKEALLAYDTTLATPVFNNGSGWQQISGTGGQGGINYILNTDGETDTSDTEVTVNVTVNRDTSNPLRGDGSLEFTFTSSAVAGNYGALDLDTIDKADRGKRLFVSFDYASDSDLDAGDLELILRDTNNNIDNFVDLTSYDDSELPTTDDLNNIIRITGAVDLQSDTATDYQLRFQVKASPSANATIRIDNVIVGPSALTPGAVVSQWTDFVVPITSSGTNPTKNGTPDHDQARWRRVGQNMEIEFSYRQSSAGTSGTGTYRFGIPSGFTIDTAFYNSAGTGAQGVVGPAAAYDGTNFWTGYARVETATDLAINLVNPSTTAVVDSSNVPLGNATARYSFTVSVRIDEFVSAGASLSTTEAVFSSVQVLGSQSTATHTSSGNYQDITYTEDLDNVGSFDGTTFTAPKSSRYSISATVAFNANATGVRSVQALVNGSTQLIGDQVSNAGGSEVTIVNYNQTVDLAKGDTIKIQGRQTSGGNLGYATSFGKMSITSVEDFSVFSVFGQTEYKEIELASNTSTASADTWTNVTGSDIVLGPGKWDIGYDVSALIDWVAGSAQPRCNTALFNVTDSARLDRTIALFFPTVITADADNLTLSVSRRTEVILTKETTFRLQARNGEANSASILTIMGDVDNAGSLTDPDTASIIWARRIS